MRRTCLLHAPARFVARRLLLALLACISVSLASPTPIAMAEIPSGGLVSAGQPVTLRARLLNSSATSMLITTAVDLPSSWRLVVPPLPMRLEPGKETIVVFTVMVPQQAAVGDHVIESSVSAGGQHLGKIRHLVEVAPSHRLTITRVAAPDLVVAEPYEVAFAIANQGNVRESVSIEAEEYRGFQLELLTPSVLSLDPRDIGEIRVLVSPPAELARPVQHMVSVRARRQPGGETMASATATVEVMAARQAETLAYRVLDMRLGLSAGFIVDRGARLRIGPLPELAGAQIEGSGQLYEDDDEVYISLSTGMKGEHPSLFSYRNHEFFLQMGNQEIPSSPLLPSAKGFGVSLITPGERFQEPLEQAFALVGPEVVAGFSVAEEVSDGLEVSLATRMTPGHAQTVGGIEFHLGDVERERLSLLAQQGLDMGSLAPGWNLELEAEGPRYELEADWTYSAAGYRAQVGPVQSYGAEFSVKSVGGPRSDLRGAYREVKQASGEFQRNASVELRGWQTDSSWSVRYLRNSSINGTNPSRRQNLRLRTHFEKPGVTIRPQLWWERADDLGEGGFAEGLGMELELDLLLPSSTLSPGVRFEYGLDDGKLDALDLSLGWHGRPTDATELRFYGSVGVIGEEPLELWAEGSHELDGGTRLRSQIQARADGEGLQRLQAELGVSVPFQLAVARRSDVGEFSGAVTDGSGKGIPGVVVWLAGFTSVTGADGTFEFPAIPPGRQALTLYGVDPGMVVVPALPHVVEVEASESQTLDLQLFEASVLSSNISVRPAEDDARSEPGAIVGRGEPVDAATLLGGLVAVLEGPSGQLRSIVGRDGSVRFTHLPPGIWTLRVVEASVPQYYRVEPAQATIELREGSSETVNFELVPVVRRIKFTDGGVVGN